MLLHAAAVPVLRQVEHHQLEALVREVLNANGHPLVFQFGLLFLNFCDRVLLLQFTLTPVLVATVF